MVGKERKVPVGGCTYISSKNYSMNWNEIQEEIKRCKKCREEGFYEVRCPDGRTPSFEPRNVKLLFISEASPLNTRYYFYYENSNDRLRNSLFEILRSMNYKISTIKDFIKAGFFLLPTVKCPSDKNGRNTAPRRKVIKLCAENHLRQEIECIKPEGICLLGRTALYGFLSLYNAQEKGGKLSEVAGKVLEADGIKFIPSYWPSKRHRKFHEISKHIKRLTGDLGNL